ncbi:MAG: hypothetical protein FJ128_10000 [Deltaproteobacteria bacterium]|nr:hypothetical protein [Deltaproteobacteria bacterium]
MNVQKMAQPTQHGPLWRNLALGMIAAAAVGFRLFDLAARNLWTDEAWVALAALQPTAAQVLAQGQSTPPLYLLTLWLLAQALGGGEAVLRSLSFAFGVGAVFLAWPLARALATPAAAWLTLTAMAASPVMVYFSKELKQYSGDAFFAALVFVLTERLLDRAAPGRWPALAAAGVLALGFSHPAVFILPVVLGAIWILRPALRRRTAALAACWGVVFLAAYLLYFRQQANPELISYWVQDFPDFSGPLALLLWLKAALARYLTFFLGEWGHVWGGPAVIIGLAAAWRRGRGRLTAYLLGPLALALAAAALHRYPFMAHFGGNRLMLFSAPLLYLTVALGVATLLGWLWQGRSRLAAALAAGLILAALNPLKVIRENYRTTINRGEIQPLVAHLESRLEPRDLVYIYYYAIYPFRYYFRGDLKQVCWGTSCVEKDLSLPEPPPRLWLLAAHIPSVDYIDRFAADLLGPQWRRRQAWVRPGALLYLFTREVAEAPTSPTSPP